MRPPCSRLDATVLRPSAAPLKRAPELARTRRPPLSMPSPRKSSSTSSSSSCALPAAAPWFESELGERVASEKLVSSSSWATAYKYETESGRAYFVKTSLGRDDRMFKTEAAGLAALAAAAASSGSSLVIPKPLHAGPLPGGRGGSFIVMEHLDLGGGGKGLSQEELGVALARLHLAPPPLPHQASSSSSPPSSPRFGFEVDNFIGGTPQPNGWSDSWVDFFREKRLKHMLSLVGRPGTEIDRMGSKLCDNLERLFDDVDGGAGVSPSLIHGDLWSGNVATVRTGSETSAWSILDPAPYFGHHEAEFGMSWCAGFGPGFWKGYRSVLPEAPGFKRRRPLYELYHILNHAVLFGSGYLGQAEGLLRTLTREL